MARALARVEDQPAAGALDAQPVGVAVEREVRAGQGGQLAGVVHDHIALRGDSEDIQLWIPHDGDPLPKRIVITYRLAAGVPRFAADLDAWNLAPDVTESLFSFTPAPVTMLPDASRALEEIATV